MDLREIRLPTARGELAALRGGTPGGPPLLCLHGWLDNAASFVPLAPHLAAHDLVALDLPGHGASAHRAPGYDYAFVDWIHDVLDAMDALGWAQADWLGHSMGGAIASMVAAAAPERVRRLALVEALGPLAGDPADAATRLVDAVAARRAFRERPTRRIPDLDAAVAARLSATAASRSGIAQRIVARNLRPFEGGFAWRSDPRLTLPASLRLGEDTIRAVLRAIRAPVLVIAADPPPAYFPAATREARLACLADGRSVGIPGGHHVHMERPDAVAAPLLDFFAAA